MSNLQITYNDVENLLLTANREKPYLVYSCRNRKLPKPSGENKINDRKVLVCWASKEDKADVVVILLDETKTAELIEQCIKITRNGGKTKFIPFLYDKLQPVVTKLNQEIDSKNVQSPLDKFKEEVAKGIGFMPVIQKSYEVTVTAEKWGTTIYNEDGSTDNTYKNHNLVITDPVGVRRLIFNFNFLEDYTTSSGEPLTDSFIASLENAGPQTICKKASKNVVWAKQIPTSLKMEVYNENGKVLISNNADVPHGNGDFIVAANTDGNKPSPTKRNLVNGVVFVKSYKKYNKEELIAQLAIEKELKELEDKEKAKSFLSDADKADIERKNLEHFKKNYENYVKKNKELLENDFDSYLERPYDSYYPVVKAFADQSGLTSYNKEELFSSSNPDMQKIMSIHLTLLNSYNDFYSIVTFNGKHYQIAPSYAYLVTGTVEKDYLEGFVKTGSSSAMFSHFDKALNYAISNKDHLKSIAEAMDSFQVNIEAQEKKEAETIQYRKNSETFFGRIVNKIKYDY